MKYDNEIFIRAKYALKGALNRGYVTREELETISHRLQDVVERLTEFATSIREHMPCTAGIEEENADSLQVIAEVLIGALHEE